MALLRLVLVLASSLAATAFMPGAAPPRLQLHTRPAAAVNMVTASTKPQRVNARNREYNKMYRSEMRTRIKNVRPPTLSPRAARPSDASLRRSLCSGVDSSPIGQLLRRLEHAFRGL